MRGVTTNSLFFLILLHHTSSLALQASINPVHVGVILDLETPVGRACMTSISMAVEDFYTEHPNYTTRLVLHAKDSGRDVIRAASAALDLLKNVEVQAILGPQTSTQAEFVIKLGSKAHVPVISSATSPSLSPMHAHYFISAALNSSAQANAVASLARAFGWREVIPIYEDLEYAKGVIPYLIDAFQEVDVHVPYRSVLSAGAMDDEITRELKKLKKMQTQVFVAHVLPPASSRLFLRAKEEGMMETGYVWIITQGLVDQLGDLEPEVIRSMSGAVGVKSYVQSSELISNFTARWSGRFSQQYPNATASNPGIFGLQAYDATRALAMAAEKVGKINPALRNSEYSSHSSTDLMSLGTSRIGPRLKQEILNTNFTGMSGEFHFVDGQLQSSTFQVVNVIEEKWRGIGFWTGAHGLSRQLLSNKTYSASNSDLENISWPGGSDSPPKGWKIPREKLRVAVPVTKGFNEFVKVDWNPLDVTGYSIEIFKKVIERLPYNVSYEFIPYNFSGHNETYNELIDQLVADKFDAVVGDVAITGNRSLFVDYTMPYTETGVLMLVPIKKNDDDSAWVFLRPFTKGLWLACLGFFLYTGFVVWVIEHRINQDFRGRPSQQIGGVFYFTFSTQVFTHERVHSNLSKVVVIIWVFVVLILTSSYKASLAAMLTAERLKPAITNVNELVENGDYVGYQDRSFVRGLLEHMKFDGSKLKPYSGVDKYVEALSRGSGNGGVAAIFDEVPYIRLVLAKYCTKYMVVGPTYKTDGLGFVFPKGSPLTADVSRAILEVKGGDNLLDVEKKYFGDPSACPTEAIATSSNRLKFRSFWVPLLMTGAVSVISLLIFFSNFFYMHRHEIVGATSSENTLRGKIVAFMKLYHRNGSSSPTLKHENIRDDNNGDSRRGIQDIQTPPPNSIGFQSPISISDNESGSSFAPLDEERLPVEENCSYQEAPTASLSK